MTVERIMTRSVTRCQPCDKLIDAAAIMGREDLGCLPVVAMNGSVRVVGMLTDRDISMAAARDDRSLEDLHVRSAMAGAAFTCRPSDSILEALRVMRARAVRRLAVVDDGGRLLGMVSLTDVARAVSGEPGKVSREARLEICRILADRARASREDTVAGGAA